MPERFSNETLYVPGGIDCHMPQSSLGTPSTETVAPREGDVRIRSDPCTMNAASYVVVWVAVTVIVCGAGGVTTYAPPNDTAYVPAATLTHSKRHSSIGIPATRTVLTRTG